MKILICDYTGISQQWLDNYTIKKNYEIVGTLTPTTDKNLLTEKNWDYLLIFEEDSRSFFKSMLHSLNIKDERVIYALDTLSWIIHPTAVFELINMENRGGQRFIAFFTML